jgi:hypothetical protein
LISLEEENMKVMIQLMIMGCWRFVEDFLDLTDFSNLKFNGFLKFEFFFQNKFESSKSVKNSK